MRLSMNNYLFQP